METRTVAVVGAGVMGTGLAQCLAATGHQVLLVDVSEEVLERARREVRHGARLQSLLGPRPSPPAGDVLRRISCSTELRAAGQAEFVIESVPERWEVKREVYLGLEAACPAAAVFASNTSAMPIARLASWTRRPDKVIGLHFMNPVSLKPVVEVVRAPETSPETLARAQALLEAMGKEGVVVNDSPGFVANRVLMLAINEAIALVSENVASPEQVDRIFTACLGHKMGPLATADLIGLDTIMLTLEVLGDELADPKYRPAALLRQMVEAGRCGRKTGHGFYRYGAEGEAAPSEGAGS